MQLPNKADIRRLMEHCEIGYIRGLRDTLTAIEAADSSKRPVAEYLSSFVEAMDMRGLMAALERVSEPAA